MNADLGVVALGGLLRLLSDGAGVKMSGKLRDSFPVIIDGIDGGHLVLDVTAGPKTVQADFLMLREGKRWWTVFVLTDPKREDSRLARAQVLNTVRVSRQVRTTCVSGWP